MGAEKRQGTRTLIGGWRTGLLMRGTLVLTRKNTWVDDTE